MLMGAVNWVTVNQWTFSPHKSILKQLVEVFTSERNLLSVQTNTSRTAHSFDLLSFLVLIQLTYFSVSVSVQDPNELEEHTP